MVNEKQVLPLLNEANELIKILASIIVKTKQKQQ